MVQKYALTSENPGREIDDREQQARAAARAVFETLTNKWTLPVLEACGDGCLRFTALHRALDGVSHKMLTQTLRSMERDGLVDRHDYRTANPRVEYSLSTAGRDLLRTVYSLCGWSRRHLDELVEGT
ncbi:winged helix-turn-helix transcriptional regulator [Rhodococcus baikonurensis]|uniref:winged helix-turn-helix transcriptional regulator n=1 Tax=Rhodococcus erythropolis group TaxID=2840174 RepID=UPI000BB39D9F|nr:helix-turn-helix domain-containing protein [Rhodococcus erythropolis]PBI86862.1 putative HTH-type transcriptional regulator YtcD [Rhodococcus erythropolis]